MSCFSILRSEECAAHTEVTNAQFDPGVVVRDTAGIGERHETHPALVKVTIPSFCAVIEHYKSAKHQSTGAALTIDSIMPKQQRAHRSIELSR